MAAVIKTVGEGTHAHDGRLTVGEFLDHWLADKVAAGLRPTTERSYRQHIRDHLKPQLGHLRLRDLRPSHVAALLRAVAQGKPGKPGPGPASVRRVHATLRSALSSAQRQQLVAFNAAANLDLPAAARPKVRPWEPAELGRFLDSLRDDRLAALFELIAATGLRRGEACGLRWSDVDLGRGVLVVQRHRLSRRSYDFSNPITGGPCLYLLRHPQHRLPSALYRTADGMDAGLGPRRM